MFLVLRITTMNENYTSFSKFYKNLICLQPKINLWTSELIDLMFSDDFYNLIFISYTRIANEKEEKNKITRKDRIR